MWERERERKREREREIGKGSERLTWRHTRNSCVFTENEDCTCVSACARDLRVFTQDEVCTCVSACVRERTKEKKRITHLEVALSFSLSFSLFLSRTHGSLSRALSLSPSLSCSHTHVSLSRSLSLSFSLSLSHTHVALSHTRISLSRITFHLSPLLALSLTCHAYASSSY